MDPAKVEAITQWQVLTTIKGVRGFLGFANFYRTFISGYSDKVWPLTELTHKDRVFKWTPEADHAFEELKAAFVSVPVLAHFDYEKPIRVETDSSGWYIGGTL